MMDPVTARADQHVGADVDLSGTLVEKFEVFYAREFSSVTGDVPSTKTAAAALSGISERKNLLVVVNRSDEVSQKSLSNLDHVHVLVSDQLNAYDVLIADDVVFTRGALESFLESPVVTKITSKVKEASK